MPLGIITEGIRRLLGTDTVKEKARNIAIGAAPLSNAKIFDAIQSINISQTRPFKEASSTTSRIVQNVSEALQPARQATRDVLSRPDIASFGADIQTPQAFDIISSAGSISGGILQNIAQSIARSGVAVSGSAVAPLFTGKVGRRSPFETEITPTGRAADILGTDEAISFENIGREFADIVGQGEEIPTALAVPLGVVGAFSDIVPGGGGRRGVQEGIELISKATRADDVASILRGFGIAEDAIPQIARTLENVTDTRQIQQEIAKVAPELFDTIAETRRVIPSTRERGFITSAKEATGEVVKIAGEYVPRSTDDLAIRAKNLIRDDIATAERLALQGTNDEAVATASELLKHYSDLARKSSGAEQIAYYDKAADIANTIAPKLTEQGRAIQAASILGRLTPEGQLRFAAKQIQKWNEEVDATKGGLFGLKKKVPELTGEQSKEILDSARAIEKMPDGVEKAIAFKRLQDQISDLVPSPLYDKLIALWKAGLLTGLKTTGLNTFSNLFHGVSEIAKDVPAVAVDSVASLFTGKRTVGLTTRGTGRGTMEGFNRGVQYFKTGYDARDVGRKLDYKRVNFGKSKFAKGLQRYEESVFRLLGAGDQPFYYGAKARSLYSQAIAQAKNAGLKGKEAQKFIDDLVQNPTDEMLKYAVNDAEMAVFQNRTLLGDAARQIQRLPGGEVVLPFGRTPSAVAMQIINYSPVGIVKTIVDNIGKGKFDQRLFAQGLGRGLTGTAVMFIGMEMAKNNLLSLDYPATERERRQWELEGRKENAIKVGDQWRSVMPLGPVGMLLLLGGQLENAIKDTGSISAALPQAAASTSKSFTEQTFLVGINQFAQALNDPDRYALSVASRTVGSIVPTLVSDIARATDPLERRTTPRTEGAFASLQSRVPGARQQLQPRVNAFGHPVERMGNTIETLIDPSRPSRIQSDELRGELRRLLEAGVPVTPTYFADETKLGNILTPEQRTYLQEKAGLMLEEKLTKLIALKAYQDMTDEDKAKTIQDFTTKARVLARAEMVHELVQGLSEEQRITKLRELKENGLLTKEVFNEWQRLFASR